MSLALVVVATLALLAMLAARAAAAAAPATAAVGGAGGGEDPSDLDAGDADLLDSGGEPHAPAFDLSRSPDGDAASGVTGTATAGVNGTATAGVNGTATAGVNGTATAGVNGDATSGATDPAHPLPATREVIAAAIRAAGLAGDPASGWRTRSRLAGLVPQLSARVGQDDTWRDVADPTLGHAITYGISASWRLERLVYDPSELRIATVDVLRRRERRRLSWYVISLYRAWRRTHNEDLAAQLDVVTDGWFSQRVLGP